MIRLEPWPASDLEAFYQLTCHSDATPLLYGAEYGDDVPDRESLFADYLPHYFDGSQPEAGRCYGIWLENERIGQVNYNAIDPETRETELDVWIGSQANWGKGYATTALSLLLEELFGQHQIESACIKPLLSNMAARKAYAKAGFRAVGTEIVDEAEYSLMRLSVADFYNLFTEMPLPYYAVIFSSLRNEPDPGYSKTAHEMEVLARLQPGYLGMESVRERLGITVSYWRDLEAIRLWKQQADHLQAQRLGRKRWYSSYRVRICKVERDYGFDAAAETN